MAHASFTPGMLVEISGLPGKAEHLDTAEGEPLDLNGTKAQLVRLDHDSEKWVAATFDGSMVGVDAKYLRALEAADVVGYDFVFGPQSDWEMIGAELAEVLANKGYAVMKLFVSEEDADEMRAVANRLEQEDHFSRLAVEFERGYLGKGGTAKTLLLDPSADSAPSYVRESPLRSADQNAGTVVQMLEPYFEDSLGFCPYSRTAMLLRMPLDEEDEDVYQPAEFDDADAEGYMHTMVRKKMEMLQFVGPAEGSLTLYPKDGTGEEVELKAEPHTLVIIMSGRYEYAYEPALAHSLTLSSILLSEPATYSLEHISGDTSALGLLSSGPPEPPGEQLSVDGIYVRYGTGAEGRMQLWNGVGRAGTDGLTEIPFVRWDHGKFYDPKGNLGGAYTKHASFGIDGVDLFDSKFFEIAPAEAKGMAPTQRQVLEVSYMALLEGGYDKRSLQRTPQNIGHFVGIDKDDWLIMTATGEVDLTGSSGAAAAANSITANRFSYSLNLKGASMQIDTACSSSLVCMHVSKLHLRYKSNEKMPAAVVNGLNLMLSVGPFIGCCQAGMLSHEGRCFTFNSTADGYARGELCGAVCIKSKQFDPMDGSLACLAGTYSNQDGRSASLTAPNGPAQEKCINGVLKECGLTPTEVDCFECHGTGTSLGDPIEVGSIRKVMSATPRKEPMSITSSKSNLAHGEGGAGLAGFVKCCLQVMHCEASANVHLKAKNPHLDLEGFPCQVLSETVVMREDSAYTGVSSFGFGGTNAHAQAWGKNIMTSRGTAMQDPSVAFQKKLQAAPAAEITMNGEDAFGWETTGLDPRAEPNSKWQIEMDEDGIATWEKAEDEYESMGDEFHIRGSFNRWKGEPLQKHSSIPGCWVGEIKLGPKGEEEFQILADGQAEKVLIPNQPRCSLKGSVINGPSKVGTDIAWLVEGVPGDIYTVEFFHHGSVATMMWLKK